MTTPTSTAAAIIVVGECSCELWFGGGLDVGDEVGVGDGDGEGVGVGS